jgi:hypothetical protein
MLVTNQRLGEIEDAFVATGMPYEQVRYRLLQGIPPSYRNGLSINPFPGVQLGLDLAAFNDIERLVDGTSPLEVWLRNSTQVLKSFPQVTELRRALDEVSARLEGSADIQDPLPPVVPAGELPEAVEKAIDRDDSLPFAFVAGAQRVGAAVCKLRVPRYDNGQPRTYPDGRPVIHLGTGWLIRPDLLVTNFHVVNARDKGEPAAPAADRALQAAATTAIFDYDADNIEGLPAPMQGLAAVDTVLDYALLRLKNPMTGRAALPIQAETIKVQSVDDYVAVNIVQHPGGLAKRVAIRNNLIYRAPYPKVHYFTDTDSGSSGSPICTDDWQVIALHRAAVPVTNAQFQGKSTGWVNEGTQLAAILEHLNQHYPTLYTELVTA